MKIQAYSKQKETIELVKYSEIVCYSFYGLNKITL